MNTITDRPASIPCPLNGGDYVTELMAGLLQPLAGARTPVSA